MNTNGVMPLTARWRVFYGWWVFLSSALVMMVGFALSAYALPVFYPELVNTFHWPRVSVAFGGSLKTLLVGLVAPINGWIIDKKGTRAILLAGVITLGIAYPFLSGINSLWQYYLICIFLGLGGSWTHHVPNQMLVANWFVKRRGLMIGTLATLAGFGNTLIPLVSAVLIKNVGWRQALLFLPVLLIAPLLAIIFIVKNRPEDMGMHPDGALESAQVVPQLHRFSSHRVEGGLDGTIFRTKGFWLLAGIFLFSAWAQFSIWQHLVLFARDKGFTPTVAASLLSMFLAGSTVGRFLGGPLCDKISADYTALMAIVITGISLAALVAAQSSLIIYASVFCFGLSEGTTVTSRPLLIFQHYGAAGVGKLYGGATAMMTTGAFVGPIISGYIHDKTGSYQLAFLIALFLVCICSGFIVLLKRDKIPAPA